MTTDPNAWKPHVYVASKFEDRERARALIDRLKDAGITITHDWTHEDDTGMDAATRATYLRKCAEDDVEGAGVADIFIMLGHPHLRGALVEFGVALGAGALCFVVAPEAVDNIFFRLWQVHLLSTDEEAFDLVVACARGEALVEEAEHLRASAAFAEECGAELAKMDKYSRGEDA